MQRGITGGIKSTVLIRLGAVALLAIAVPLNAAQSVSGETPAADRFDRTAALSVSQAAIGRKVGDQSFYSSQGVPKKLSGYAGKPLVISLVYTSCHHICPTTTQHLAKVVGKARAALGQDSFSVVTVGFDTANDTADAMRMFAAQQNVGMSSWDFLSGDRGAIDALADDLGFQFFPSPSGFDHLIQSTIVDAEGSVFRQVYGIQFETPHLIEPLKVLVYGENENASLLEQITARVNLFCTVYDPASDSYKFDYSIFVGLVMGLVLGGVFVYLVAREWSISKKASEA